MKRRSGFHGGVHFRLATCLIRSGRYFFPISGCPLQDGCLLRYTWLLHNFGGTLNGSCRLRYTAARAERFCCRHRHLFVHLIANFFRFNDSFHFGWQFGRIFRSCSYASFFSPVLHSERVGYRFLRWWLVENGQSGCCMTVAAAIRNITLLWTARTEAARTWWPFWEWSAFSIKIARIQLKIWKICQLSQSLTQSFLIWLKQFKFIKHGLLLHWMCRNWSFNWIDSKKQNKII